MATAPMRTPPVLLVGGDSNALALARSLARHGIEVYALNHDDSYICRSRHARVLPLDYRHGYAPAWRRFLLGNDSNHLEGAVLLPMVDEAIEVVVGDYQALAERFVLEETDSELRKKLLDKLDTYDLALAAGVATPWYVKTPDELEQVDPSQRFPLILKPRLSHKFRGHYRGKYIRIEQPDQLQKWYDKLAAQGLEVVLMQFIEGEDDLLCSYYSYLDESGEPLFHFTKRILRRFPPNMGPATYHITDWNPAVRDLGLRFFQNIGLRGLGNVEFKLDRRDGQLKLIECNARFTEGTCLAHASGCDMGLLVYNRLTGKPLPAIDDYKRGLRLLDPLMDCLAYRALKAEGKLGLGRWLSSLLHYQTFPYFSLRDPMPTLRTEAKRAGGFLGRRLRLRQS